MFIPNDGITEVVAHFIGYFEIRVEDLRYRADFDRFSREPEARPAEGHTDPHQIDFHEAMTLRSFVPDVAYTPPPYAIIPGSVIGSVSFDHISVPMPKGGAAPAPPTPHAGPAAQMAAAMQAPAPGSTIAIVSQVKYLMDDDVLVVGDHAFDAAFRLAVHAEVEGLAGQALAVSAGLTELADLRSVTQMVDLVEDASALARGLHEDDFGPLDSLFLKVADRIDGHFSNGVAVDAPVTLAEAFAALDDEGDAPPPETDLSSPQTASLTIDAATTPTTMNVSSGGNVSWNEAAIVNAGLPSSVVAVAGDYHRIDAIYQTNVLRDIDVIDDAWPAENIAIGGNVVQNSASFVSQSYEARTGDTAAAGGGFPQSWNVTTVDGDMIFLNWVQQYSFTSDNDTQILTAMGTHTYISSGLNLGFNMMGFVDLGLYFDLVFIGGSLYDGNFITQTNILLDSDKLSVPGESSAWRGSAATGENVLWSEASIENVGPSWTQGLPSHYEAAAASLAAGGKQMPDGFKSDAALDGLGNLKVLYIAGNVYDIQSISQVNIVGDADDLTVYEASLIKAQDSVWQVSTGHNLLVNKASILDYDSLGNSAYVGGQLYSDAVLVQAEIVEGLTDRLTVRGDALANEVIAFLDDHTDLASRLDDHPAIQTMADAGTTYDVMHSVLA